MHLATLLSSSVFFGIYSVSGVAGVPASVRYFWSVYNIIKINPYQRRHGLDAAGYTKHVIEMNSITISNTLLVFYFNL